MEITLNLTFKYSSTFITTAAFSLTPYQKNGIINSNLKIIKFHQIVNGKVMKSLCCTYIVNV